jgi:hypothetical protein
MGSDGGVDVRIGVRALQTAVVAWSVEHGNRYPPAAELQPGHDTALGAAYLPTWPQNPYTHEPMRIGTDPGDFSYWVSADGLSYRLAGHVKGHPDFVISATPRPR